MKKVIVSALLLTVCTTTMFASVKDSTQSATITAASAKSEDNKTKIDPATLPDAIKTTLSNNTYKDWKVSTAWVIKSEPLVYTVELKKDDKTVTINLDKDGNVK